MYNQGWSKLEPNLQGEVPAGVLCLQRGQRQPILHICWQQEIPDTDTVCEEWCDRDTGALL